MYPDGGSIGLRGDRIRVVPYLVLLRRVWRTNHQLFSSIEQEKCQTPMYPDAAPTPLLMGEPKIEGQVV